jgi:hypothetical protein
VKANNARCARQNGTDSLTLNADATAVNQTDLRITLLGSSLQITFHGCGYIGRRKRMKVQRILNRKFNRFRFALAWSHS